tara:strand:- start:1463 stop:2596 length:1134 start_codon:yes stop_codon:yes gene_type:complete
VIYLIFFLGFLLGVTISLVLLFVTSLREKIFGPLLDKLSSRLEDFSKKEIENIERLKKEEIEKAEKESNIAAQATMKTLVASESENIKKLINEAKEKLASAETTWNTQHVGSMENLKKLNENFIKWQTALTNPVKQGLDSEMALESLLDSIGFVKNLTYKTQKVMANDEGQIFKPDIFVKTKGNRWFVIDSKAPMSAFDRIARTENEREKNTHLDELSNNFKEHIKSLGKKKYPELDNKTARFTVMFVPNAALYLSVINHNGDEILELSRKNDVFISPPGMIIPLLQMFNEGLEEEDFEAKKGTYRELVTKLIEAIGYLDKHFIDAEKGIAKAQKSLSSFRSSWNTYLPSRSRELIKQQDLDVDEVKGLLEKSGEDD